MEQAWGELLQSSFNICCIKAVSASSSKIRTIQVAFLNLPTTDLFSAPNQQRLEEGVAWMMDETSSGKGSVYVHWPYCKNLCTYCNFVKYVPRKGASWNIDQQLFIQALVSNK